MWKGFQDQKEPPGPLFRNFGSRQRKNAEVFQGSFRRIVPWCVQQLGKTLEWVFRLERKLLYRILFVCTFKCNDFLLIQFLNNAIKKFCITNCKVLLTDKLLFECSIHITWNSSIYRCKWLFPNKKCIDVK